jgi:uncharacterized protein YecT (DUF1311 family)
MSSSLCLATVVFTISVTAAQQPAEKKLPSDNCGNLKVQMEITNCWENLAQKADAQLTAVYQRVRKSIQAKIAEEKGGPLVGYQQRALQKLRVAQLAWSHYRELECDAEEQQFEGGTIAPLIHAGCMKELADRRLDNLQKTYAIYLGTK